MLRNYFLTALRSFSRNKTYPILNILGLTAGIAVFILITVYVNYEFSYDDYHWNKDRIYRVVKIDVDNYYQGHNHFAVTPAPLAPTMMTEFPEIELATRFIRIGNRLIGTGDQTYFEPSIHGTDRETFQIFTFKTLYGQPENYLKDKYTAVISESISKKYFGDDNPVGEVIRYRDEQPFTITGVIEDMPGNSHFTMDIMLDYESVMEVDDRDLTHWNNNSFYTYLLLKEGSDANQLEAKFPALRDKYTNDKLDKDGQETTYYLQEFPRIHLHSDAIFDIGPTSDERRLYTYLFIAFLILGIACINYVNLSTARAMTRSKEVGIRKVVGAHRNNLIGQFLGESLILSLTALVLAVACVHFILPHFTNFVGLDIQLDYSKSPQWILFYAALFLVVGLVSGAYPAFLLSSMRPISSLYEKTKTGKSKVTLRNALVVSQFAISGILITCTLIIAGQMKFIQNKDMGYVRDQIAVLRIRDGAMRENLPVFKNELRKIPGVSHVSSSSSLPNNTDSSTGANWPGKSDDVEFQFYTLTADYEYLDLFGMKLSEGRWFDESMGDGPKTMLLNETAVKTLGWDDPIGKEMITWVNDTAKIIGVIKDFHQHSLHLSMEPLQIFFGENQYDVSVKINSDEVQTVLADIEDVYSQFSAKYPFDYVFFDEEFDKAYQTEIKTARLSFWATALTILIACLGLYGLALYTAEQKLREIGIRKILGASISGILILLSRNFASLIIVAFIISVPVSYYIMSDWLRDFAYHIPIRISYFAFSLLTMSLIGFMTISYRTILAARGNPVEILKEE